MGPAIFFALCACLLLLHANPAHAQRPLTNAESDLQIFAFQTTLRDTAEREKLGIINADLRQRVESAQANLSETNRLLQAERSRSDFQQERIKTLEDAANVAKANFASAVEELTSQLASQDRDYRAKLDIALADGRDYQETEAGRKALALFAEGGAENISAGLTLVDQILALEDQIEAFARAARYRRAARTYLGFRGTEKGTTEKIIELYEEVVAYDPLSAPDWLELARLYRDARRIEDAEDAADKAVRLSKGDAERGIALFERAEVAYISWVDPSSFEDMALAALSLQELYARLEEDSEEARTALLLKALRLFANLVAPKGEIGPTKAYFAQSIEATRQAEGLDPKRRAMFVGLAQLRAGEVLYHELKGGAVEILIEQFAAAISESRDINSIKVETLVEKGDHLKNVGVEMGQFLNGGLTTLRPLINPEEPLQTARALGAVIVSFELILEFQELRDDMLNNIQQLALFSQLLATAYPDLVPAQKLNADARLLLAKIASRTQELDKVGTVLDEAFATYDALIAADPTSANLRVGRLRAWIDTANYGAGPKTSAEIDAEFQALKADNLLSTDDEAKLLFARANQFSNQIDNGSKIGPTLLSKLGDPASSQEAQPETQPDAEAESRQ
ncbi:MAG: hypothetical protein AAFR88_03125 [Pseudomonadota bacterium]